MLKRIKQLGKDSLIYGLGGILARGISFFLLPIYTRIFLPSEYGIIEMLSVISGFLGFILGMGMDSSQSYFFFEQKGHGKTAQAAMISAILQWRVLWGSGIVIMATILSPFINLFFFRSELSWEYFAISFASALFGQVMSQSTEVFRLLFKPIGFIGITLGQTVFSAAIGLFLILKLGMGIKGYLTGSLMGSGLAALLGWYFIRGYLEVKTLHREWWPRLLKFGLPLVPAGLTMYILNTSDRWFISYFKGQEALGLYAVGAKFAMIVALAVSIFRKAWWPIAMDAMHDENAPVFFQTIGRLYMGLASAGIVVLTALSPYLVRWFTAPQFHAAYPIVGVLSWYSIFYGFYLIASIGIWKTKKTYWAPILTGFAALLNVALDAVFVPPYGIMGAAIATSASFLFWSLLTLIVSERLWKVSYPLIAMGFQVVLGFLATILILKVYSKSISINSVLFPTIAAVTVIAGSCLSKVHAQQLLSAYKTLRKSK